MSGPKPTEINYHQKSRIMDLTFDDGQKYEISAEYLRCFSPSAEVQGHGPGEEVLQLNKQNVRIERIEPVGNYAICLHFDDGHNTGIYSWDTLYRLGKERDTNWSNYLQRLQQAGHSYEVSTD